MMPEQSAPQKEINYLKLKGYSLVLKQEILGDTLKTLLKKSKLFQNDPNAEGSIRIEPLQNEVESNNIAAFIVYIKLNNPMRY